MFVLKTCVQGALIGIANIIPGVSGGTLALILGIYGRTIRAVHAFDLRAAQNALGTATGRPGAHEALRADLRRMDLLFLACLGAGALAAVLATSRLMGYLLRHQHAAAYAFFFGLVLVSMLFPYRHLRRRSWREAVAFVAAAALMAGMALAVSEEDQVEKARRKQARQAARARAGDAAPADSKTAARGAEERGGFVSLDTPPPARLVGIGLAAAVAISAMVLPGISGSFVLLMLGVYFDLLAAIDRRQIVVLAVFALGCGGGLLVFVRIMNVLLDRFFSVTMAFMIGLMAGSLCVLWPFKRTVTVGAETLYLGNVLRGASVNEEVTALCTFLAGALLILAFDLLTRRSRGRAA